MTVESHRVLVTGSRGFIGGELRRALGEAGHEVWGMDRLAPTDPREIEVDLLDPAAVRYAVAAVPPVSAVIHTAALAHNEPLPRGRSRTGINTAITDNLLRAFEGQDPRLIFLSSVAVYGEDRRVGPVGVDADLRPATDYGRSKLACEEMILDSAFTHCDVLRLAPVFDDRHLRDIAKRVFLPRPLRVKIRIRPTPSYSLCRVETLVSTTVELLRTGPAGRRVWNVADPIPYDQTDLVSRFPGWGLPLPAALAQPVYWASHLLPAGRGYALRCLLWKLLRSNVYQTGARPLDRRPRQSASSP